MSLFPLRLIPHTTNFNFMRVRWVSIAIAALLTVGAIGAIAFKGFNFALDFTGGTVVELRFQTPPNVDEVRERLARAPMRWKAPKPTTRLRTMYCAWRRVRAMSRR